LAMAGVADRVTPASRAGSIATAMSDEQELQQLREEVQQLRQKLNEIGRRLERMSYRTPPPIPPAMAPPLVASTPVPTIPEPPIAADAETPPVLDAPPLLQAPLPIPSTPAESFEVRLGTY